MRRIRAHGCWEETEDDHDSPVANRECIECDTPYTGNMERAPNERIRGPGTVVHFARFSNIATDAAPEKKCLNDGVGKVEGRDTDRKDDVEGCGGAEVYDTKQAHGGSYDKYRVVWDCSLWMHLVARESETVDAV